MKKLSAADIELLKLRGKVKDGVFHTKKDDEVIIPSGEKKKKVNTAKKGNPYIALYKKAEKAGKEALEKTVPTPMTVVQHANPFNDNSPVVEKWHVPSGACGFAWVNVKYRGEGAKFINALKKEGLAGGENSWSRWRKDSYYGGYTYWVHDGNQSIELKEAYARAFVRVLAEAGIKAYAQSRLD